MKSKTDRPEQAHERPPSCVRVFASSSLLGEANTNRPNKFGVNGSHPNNQIHKIILSTYPPFECLLGAS
jgi:hypothetical protein